MKPLARCVQRSQPWLLFLVASRVLEACRSITERDTSLSLLLAQMTSISIILQLNCSTPTRATCSTCTQNVGLACVTRCTWPLSSQTVGLSDQRHISSAIYKPFALSKIAMTILQKFLLPIVI